MPSLPSAFTEVCVPITDVANNSTPLRSLRNSRTNSTLGLPAVPTISASGFASAMRAAALAASLASFSTVAETAGVMLLRFIARSTPESTSLPKALF